MLFPNHLKFLRDVYGDTIPADLTITQEQADDLARCVYYMSCGRSDANRYLILRYGMARYGVYRSWKDVGYHFDKTAKAVETSANKFIERLRQEPLRAKVLDCVGLYTGEVPDGAPESDLVPVQFEAGYKKLLAVVLSNKVTKNIIVDGRLKAVMDRQIEKLPSQNRDPMVLRYGLHGPAASYDELAADFGLRYPLITGRVNSGVYKLRDDYKLPILHEVREQLKRRGLNVSDVLAGRY